MRSKAAEAARLAAMLLACYGAMAQERDSLPPLQVGGFVDTYFSWNTAMPASHVNQLRNFDIAENQFVLTEAQVDVQRTAAPIGFHIALNTGAASDVIHAGSSSSMNLLMQGFLTVVLPLGAGLTLDAGKFVTHMGFETISAKDNFNYSRSFLFAWAIPYYHLGARATYPFLEQLTASACVSNGWNAASLQRGKTFGASLAFTPLPALVFTANWIGGPGQSDSASSSFRQIAELTSTCRVTDHLTLAADVLYGMEPQAGRRVSWEGVALYGRWTLTDKCAFALRGEVYDDPAGHTTGLAQTLSELTLTYEQRVLEYLLLRVEYRHDRSSAGVFDGSAGAATNSRQNTVALSGVVVF